MIKLYTTRHGQALCNEAKLAASISEKHCGGLSKLGEKQAEDLVPKLLENKYDAIIISPMIRTHQTLIPYFKTFSYPPKIIISDLILERDLGDLRGKTLLETKKAREGMTDSERVSWIPPKGESFLDVYERAKKFVLYLKENFEGQSILVCSHSAFLRTLDVLLNNKEITDFYSYEEPQHGVLREYEIK